MRLFLAHGVGAQLGEPRAGFGGSQAGGIAAGRLGSFAGNVEWWSGFHIPKRRPVLANALVILAMGVRLNRTAGFTQSSIRSARRPGDSVAKTQTFKIFRSSAKACFQFARSSRHPLAGNW